MSRSDVTLSRMFIRRMMALAGMMTLLPAHEYLNHRPESKSPKSTFVMFFVVSKTVLFFWGALCMTCFSWLSCFECFSLLVTANDMFVVPGQAKICPSICRSDVAMQMLIIFVTLQPLVSAELIALSILWSRLSGGLSMFLLSKSFECSTRFNSLFPGLGYGRTGAVWFSFRFSKQSHHNGIDLSVHTQGLHGFALAVLVHFSILLKTDLGGCCICLIFLLCCYSTEMFIFALCRLCQE